jgi:hypothetical protein
LCASADTAYRPATRLALEVDVARSAVSASGFRSSELTSRAARFAARKTIEAYLSVGATDFFVHSGREDQARVIDFFGNRVLPPSRRARSSIASVAATTAGSAPFRPIPGEQPRETSAGP